MGRGIRESRYRIARCPPQSFWSVNDVFDTVVLDECFQSHKRFWGSIDIADGIEKHINTGCLSVAEGLIGGVTERDMEAFLVNCLLYTSPSPRD